MSNWVFLFSVSQPELVAPQPVVHINNSPVQVIRGRGDGQVVRRLDLEM